MMIFPCDGVENIVGKGDVFERLLFQGREKSGLCGKGLTLYQMIKFYM